MTELATPEFTLVGEKTINEVRFLSYKLGWNSGKSIYRPCAERRRGFFNAITCAKKIKGEKYGRKKSYYGKNC